MKRLKDLPFSMKSFSSLYDKIKEDIKSIENNIFFIQFLLLPIHIAIINK